MTAACRYKLLIRCNLQPQSKLLTDASCKLHSAIASCSCKLPAASCRCKPSTTCHVDHLETCRFVDIWRFYTQTIRHSMRLLEELRIQGGQDLRHSYLTQGCHGISDISCGRVQVACGRLGPPPRVRGMPESRPVVSRRLRLGAYPSKIGRGMPDINGSLDSPHSRHYP